MVSLEIGIDATIGAGAASAVAAASGVSGAIGAAVGSARLAAVESVSGAERLRWS